MVVSWIIQNLHTGNLFLVKYGAPGQSTQGPNQEKNKSSSLPLRFLRHAMIRGGVQDVVILQWQGHWWSEKRRWAIWSGFFPTFQMFELVHGGDVFFGNPENLT